MNTRPITTRLPRIAAGLFLSAMTAAAATAAPASAQAAPESAWPAKPIVLVVAYPAGGTSDLLARLLSAGLNKRFGQPVIVENRPGAGGTIGTEYVSRAKPDGYTFLVGSSSPITIAGALYPKLGYQPARDLTDVAPLVATPFFLTVNAATGMRTVQDVIDAGKGGKLNFGSAGSGSPQHILGEMFNTATHTRLQHIPYKGSGPLLTDLVGGQVQLTFESPVVVMPQVQTGKLKALAVTGEARTPLFPDIPTFKELGVHGLEAQPWYGVFGPARLPPAIAGKMNEAVQDILRQPDVQAGLRTLGADAMLMDPAPFKAMVDRDIATWSSAVKKAGATID
ncbi:Bug family tripartite tricarboxylate transporter substrate binding protein [Bordetella genomosp. 10]|nr:tripartite tricarboxylate transporter substrate binding protein [Bordetella genomosp. 10]